MRRPITGGGSRPVRRAAAAALALSCLGGCESPFERIDRRTTELLEETNDTLGEEAQRPRLGWPPGAPPPEFRSAHLADYDPATTNPDSDEIRFQAAEEARGVLERLRGYAQAPEQATRMALTDALTYAVENSREYRFAEEDFLLDALGLLSERHLWGPRLFNDTVVTAEAFGDDGLYDSSLRIINDLRVTQRLPYGGEVAARLLAEATEDLHERVAGENVQTAELILEADVPLLRGAGLVAREDLIQSERNVIYAARRFERFRRVFLVDITTDFLDLIVQLQAIENAQRSVEQFEEAEERERALVEAGRKPPFDAALAAQDTLFARDALNNQLERYRLAVDRFKVRLGMPEQRALVIVPSSIGLPTPAPSPQEAVEDALRYRLDLQNTRDRVDDARRDVNNARNAVLADLDLTASVSVPTTEEKDRAGLDFDFEDPIFRASLALGLPLDRTIERLGVRQSQVDLQRAIRDYDEFRDTVAVEVRAAVRDIDRALFSVELQAENVRIAERRLASIEAAPDRASARDRSEAVQGLLRARDDLDSAQRDLQVAILAYLLAGGRLRVADDGTLLPLRGMELDGQGEPDPAGEAGPGA